jgi:DNA polymerase-3 subunit epsilon
MRQIVLDTETTGLEPEKGHRIVEIACLEVINRQMTGKHFHSYLNPGRLIEPGAAKVHGITDDFLKDKPVFSDIVEEFFNFIKGAELIIHNAPFDMGFLDAEFKLLSPKREKISKHCKIIDTLAMARALYPGQRNSLDALCKRHSIDNSNRNFHGALIDTELLALVYLAMTAGQDSLFADEQEEVKAVSAKVIQQTEVIDLPVLMATVEELAAHEGILRKMKQ